MHSFERIWPEICPVIDRLLSEKVVTRDEWQNLSHDVYKICCWDEKGPYKLLAALRTQFTYLLSYKIKPELISVQDDRRLLEVYSNCWLEFNKLCNQFPAAFQQLDLATKLLTLINESPATKEHNSNTDRPISKLEHKRKVGDSTVKILMLKLWNDIIVDPFCSKLLTRAVDLITVERNGQRIDPQLIVNLKESFKSLDTFRLSNNKDWNYIELYRRAYLSGIESFYIGSAKDFLKENNIIDFVRWASEKIKNEMESAKIYLEPSSENIPKLIDVGSKAMQVFEFSLDKVEHQKCRFSDLVARYIDLYLIGTTKRSNNNLDKSHWLAENLTIIKLMSDKESFIQLHKILLSKRLLLNTTVDMNLEWELIDSFENIPGMPSEELSKIRRKFKDIFASQAIQNKFKETLEFPEDVKEGLKDGKKINATRTVRADANSNNVEESFSNRVDIRVLNPVIWSIPTNDLSPAVLPDEISSVMEKYERFYRKEHQGRNLMWSNRLSTGTVSFRSDKGQFDLLVTAEQLSVLNALDEGENEQLMKSMDILEVDTKMRPQDLKRTLWVSSSDGFFSMTKNHDL